MAAVARVPAHGTRLDGRDDSNAQRFCVGATAAGTLGHDSVLSCGFLER